MNSPTANKSLGGGRGKKSDPPKDEVDNKEFPPSLERSSSGLWCRSNSDINHSKLPKI